jgi:hypothetical protein
MAGRFVFLPAGVTINPGETKRLKMQTSVPVFVIPDAVFALRNNGVTTGTGKLITPKTKMAVFL